MYRRVKVSSWQSLKLNLRGVFVLWQHKIWKLLGWRFFRRVKGIYLKRETIRSIKSVQRKSNPWPFGHYSVNWCRSLFSRHLSKRFLKVIMIFSDLRCLKFWIHKKIALRKIVSKLSDAESSDASGHGLKLFSGPIRADRVSGVTDRKNRFSET